MVKVDFGDFQFLRIEPKVVRFVSGVATALLGSGGLFIYFFNLLIKLKTFFFLFDDDDVVFTIIIRIHKWGV